MEIGALLGARRAGLKQSVMNTTPGPLIAPKAPLWRLAPPPAPPLLAP